MDDKIILDHGSGGKLTHQLIDNIFLKYFNNPLLSEQTDSALLTSSKDIAFTTDSYVVDPIFFPGGDIGKLAICGTVNDIAVSGATPKYISASFIIEEGFPLHDLEKIVKSMNDECKKMNISIVTGDTKVVNKNKCDKIFINTTGIGFIEHNKKKISSGQNIKQGDRILINGDIGDHGIAILSARESLKFSSSVISDCSCLYPLIKSVHKECDVHFMRDATRGGLATVLCEIASKNKFGIEIDETKIPVNDSVNGACEIFGYDPLYMANEGKVVMIISKKDTDKALSIMKTSNLGKNAQIIGEVKDKHHGIVLLKTSIGGKRIIDMLSGEQLPRIC